MANTTGIEGVLARAVAPIADSTTGTLSQEMSRLTGQLQQLQTVNQAALDSVRTNTQVVKETSVSSGESGSTARSVLGTVFGVLGAGLGLSPLVSGITRLFGGGGSSNDRAPLVKFALPGSQSVSAGVSSTIPGVFAVDSGQGGLPRPVAAQQITVQVQAMDSRSFLDHSGDIAAAVRQAMLESSVLNDVVREA